MNPASLSRGGAAAPLTVSAPTQRGGARRAPLRVCAASTVEAFVPSERLVRPAREGPIIMDGAVLHSATHQQLDVIESMQTFFGENVLPLLTPVDELWQPSDFLPESHEESFIEEVSGAAGVTKGVGGWGGVWVWVGGWVGGVGWWGGVCVGGLPCGMRRMRLLRRRSIC